MRGIIEQRSNTKPTLDHKPSNAFKSAQIYVLPELPRGSLSGLCEPLRFRSRMFPCMGRIPQCNKCALPSSRLHVGLNSGRVNSCGECVSWSEWRCLGKAADHGSLRNTSRNTKRRNFCVLMCETQEPHRHVATQEGLPVSLKPCVPLAWALGFQVPPAWAGQEAPQGRAILVVVPPALAPNEAPAPAGSSPPGGAGAGVRDELMPVRSA